MIMLKNATKRQVRISLVCSYVVLVSAAVTSFVMPTPIVYACLIIDAILASAVTAIALTRFDEPPKQG